MGEKDGVLKMALKEGGSDRKVASVFDCMESGLEAVTLADDGLRRVWECV